MNKKFLIIGMILLIVTELFSGCGRKIKKREGRITLRFENWEVTPEQLSLWKEVTDKFNQSQSGLYVKFQPVQGGTQKIITEMAGGAAPDIFYWGAPGILSPLVAKKAVVDLTPFIEEEDINPADYFPSVWNASKFEGKIYGLPCYWGTDAIAFNKELFDQENIPYPSLDWTWEEFLKIAQRLTKRKGGRMIQYGCTPPDSYHIMIQFGGSWFNEKGKFTADSPEGKAALTFLQDLRYKYKVAPSLASLPPDFYRGEIDFFMTGRVAMFRANTFVLPVLKKIKQFRWDLAPIPRSKGKRRAFEEGSGVLCISSQTKYPKEAFEFVRFACGEEGETILAKGGALIPALKEVAEKSFTPPPENIKIYIDQVESIAFSPRRSLWYREWDAQIRRPEMDKLMINKQSPEETLINIKRKTEGFLKRYHSATSF